MVAYPVFPPPSILSAGVVLALGSVILIFDLSEMAIDALLPGHPPGFPEITKEVEYEVECKGISSNLLESDSLPIGGEITKKSTNTRFGQQPRNMAIK